MTTEVIEPARFTRKFIELHGANVLERLGEAPLAGARWHISTYGGVVRVEGEHDELFERLAVVLPSPQDVTPARFHAWAEQRIEHLHWYMEQANIGLKDSHTASSRCVVGVFVRRVGRSIQDPMFVVPKAAVMAGLLEKFVLDVEKYVKAFGDEDLKYVRAVKVFKIPRKKVDDEYVIGLDVLPTLIGLEGEPAPINPLTLVRGVLGEFAELLDQTRERLRGESGGRLGRKTRTRLQEYDEFVGHLDALCRRIDVERPSLSAVRRVLGGLKPLAKRLKVVRVE